MLRSFLILLVLEVCYVVHSDLHFVSSFCIKKSGSYTRKNLYRDNLRQVFSNLTSTASLRSFSNFTAGERLDKVYALFYCRGDLKLSDCRDCVETATTRIVFECPNEKEAIIFFEECTFRFANRSFFSIEEEDPNDWSYNETMVPDKDQFNNVLTVAMGGLFNQGAFSTSKRGFATKVTTNSSANQTLYSLAQCTPDILGNRCQKCLVAALGNLLDEGKTRMSLFMPSCQVMYSLAPFFDTENRPPNSPPFYPATGSPTNAPEVQPPSLSQRTGNSKLYIAVGVSCALGLVVFLIAVWFWLHKRKAIAERKQDKEAQQISNNVHSTFTYKELALATENFSSANLVGQGGFGYVYKGVLSSGKYIAVKQLKTGSSQGEREFQAEIETISRVNHKHLVLLLGYCIYGDQRMLVYEFIPNQTLEFHLHGEGIRRMSWATRLKIALGAAKGLAYLHEDCHPKIIHRDIKATNILLDDEFEAKVADFGLAKFILDADTHVSTRVMGTFGYLAPEYAASGKLTEKSDVFSFGVVLLELITGCRPLDKVRFLMDDNIVEWSKPLLTKALQGGSITDLVDPTLETYNPCEMAQMIVCAVACVRAVAKQRPRMSKVVVALEGNLSTEDLLKESIDENIIGSSDVEHEEDSDKWGKAELQSYARSTGISGMYSASTSEPVSTSSNEHRQDTQEKLKHGIITQPR